MAKEELLLEASIGAGIKPAKRFLFAIANTHLAVVSAMCKIMPCTEESSVSLLKA